MYRPEKTSAPVTFPVTLAEVKSHCRVDYSDDDDLLNRMIEAATSYMDGWTGILGRCLVEQSWKQDFDCFAQKLYLPLGPVSAIESVKWRNEAGQMSTVSSDDYALQTDAGGRSFVRFKDDYDFPDDLHETAAVSVTYTAGYPDVDGATTVPQPIRHAMLLLIGHWYENREAIAANFTPAELPMAVDALIAPYRRILV